MHLPNSALWGAMVAYLATVVAASFAVRPGSPQQRALFATVFLVVVGGFANVVFPFAGFIAAIAGIVCAAAVCAWGAIDHRNVPRRWLARAKNAIDVRAPFEGRWRVADGGPDPRHNRHHATSDRAFAYAFTREGGDSWNQAVLAPCRGMVAHVEDRAVDAAPDQAQHDRKHPFGNYVSIETPRGYVILAHLQRGTIAVRPGSYVGPGELVAHCGNSGDSSGARIHIHAQQTAFADPGIAQGVPIAFVDGSGEPLLLEYGDVLSA